MIRRAIAAAALLASCHAWAGGTAVVTDNEAAIKAADVTRDYVLSKDKTACLLFDTGVSPVLFFLKIRKRDGYTVTTAYDSEHYRPLRPLHKD
jgi:hypothetical protein